MAQVVEILPREKTIIISLSCTANITVVDALRGPFTNMV